LTTVQQAVQQQQALKVRHLQRDSPLWRGGCSLGYAGQAARRGQTPLPLPHSNVLPSADAVAVGSTGRASIGPSSRRSTGSAGRLRPRMSCGAAVDDSTSIKVSTATRGNQHTLTLALSGSANGLDSPAAEQG
jgi:hypothetical protein